MGIDPGDEVFCVQVADIAVLWGNVVDSDDPVSAESQFWHMPPAQRQRVIDVVQRVFARMHWQEAVESALRELQEPL